MNKKCIVDEFKKKKKDVDMFAKWRPRNYKKQKELTARQSFVQ